MKQGDNRIAGGNSRRCSGWAFVIIFAAASASIAWADNPDTTTNTSPAATNSPAAAPPPAPESAASASSTDTNAPATAQSIATNTPAASPAPEPAPTPTADSPAPVPPPATNAPGSSFIESHPELTGPVPASPSDLSLRPDASSSSAPPEVTPSMFPEVPPAPPIGQLRGLADHLLVVYNKDDPDSPALAQYYATRREIPAERVLGISCPLSEEITRAQFDDTIRSPIVTYLTQKFWMTRSPRRARVGGRLMDVLVATHNDIWAIVLIRGVPLKIAPDPSDEDAMEPQPELQTDAAAVDNELALLPVFGLPKGGYVPNIFFDDQVEGIKHASAALATNMVFVTRLDGPSASEVRRMIDDTLLAEQNRLAGRAVIDTRGFTDVKDGYTQGDIWLRNARDMLAKDGWSIEFDDKPDVLPATDPCNKVAIYLGWYHDGATGPWVTPPNRFVPGAIAYHLHSFSAMSVRTDIVGWVGSLIDHGADATMGMVYEPYLALTPHEDIFMRRLLQGDCFAEAAYASERALSWMLTVVGDPLYRPFQEPLDSALADAGLHHTDHDDWLLLQKVQRELVAGQLADTADNLRQALDVPGGGPVVQEGLGDLLLILNDAKAGPFIEMAYKKAQAAVVAPVDHIRIGLKLAQYYSNHGKDALAQSELDSLRQLYPDDAKRFGVPGPLVPTSAAPVKTR